MHMSSVVPPPKRKASKSDKQFPGKLYDLIAYAEREGREDIIGWVREGKAFAVHDPDRLVTDLLPLFFGQTKYRSFRRQLNMWSFERVLGSPHKGIFTHPYFVRGEKERCIEMCRHDFQVAGIESMQLAQESIIREVYSNAPMLADSPGNIANYHRNQPPSYLSPQELAPARPSTISGVLPLPKQDFAMFDGDALPTSAQSSPPSPSLLSIPVELRPQNSERRPSVMGIMSEPNLHSTSQGGTAPIPLSSLSASSNIPMISLQPVQLSLDPVELRGKGEYSLRDQNFLGRPQQATHQDLSDDSSEDKKMPAVANARVAQETKDDSSDDIAAGVAIAFEGRQFFFVDASGSNEERIHGTSPGAELDISNLGSSEHSADLETTLSFPTNSSQIASSDKDARNQLLQQFAHWKSHGPPDEDMGEDEFDNLFD